MDGCGLTAARVEFRKQRRDGTWLIGLAMNRTQCRSTSDDFLVDPLLLRPATAGEAGTGADRGLPRRRLLHRARAPDVAPAALPAAASAVGDIVVFPNTAGYLMHILESASHQIPLARNLVARSLDAPVLDRIDA